MNLNILLVNFLGVQRGSSISYNLPNDIVAKIDLTLRFVSKLIGRCCGTACGGSPRQIGHLIHSFGVKTDLKGERENNANDQGIMLGANSKWQK